MKHRKLSTVHSIVTAVSTIALLGFVVRLAQAADPAVSCESRKLKTAGKYASCVLSADSKAVKTGGVTDYSACVSKFGTSWQRAENNGEGMCPGDSGDRSDVQTFLDYCTQWVANGLRDPGGHHWKEWPVSKGGNGHRYSLTRVFCTWYECRDEAVAAGGHLVTINDAAENAWLTQQFGTPDPLFVLWVGFNDLATEGHWEWVGGDGGWWENENPASTSYVNWWPGTPEPSGGSYENAAFLVFDARAGSWLDATENASNRGIIEIDVP